MATIGFDAKRAFQNETGLGNYSRTLINSLQEHAPQHQYVLYTPKVPEPILYKANIPVRTPKTLAGRKVGAFWRSRGIVPSLSLDGVDLYHGLSNELPFGLKKAGIRSVVTIHDLVFLKRPEDYKGLDRWIYERKLHHAINTADRIVAISEQTRQDILEHTEASEDRVSVIYQSCDEGFRRPIASDIVFEVKKKYSLPQDFVLHVGGWNPRKNLERTIQAIASLPKTIRPVLVALGALPREVLHEIDIIYLPSAISSSEIQALYQSAQLVVYPSLYEGFGLPVLEALSSGTPVITSPGGCMQEIAGEAATYVDPEDIENIRDAIRNLLLDTTLRDSLTTAGRARAAWFSPSRLVKDWLVCYEKALIT